MCSVSLCLKQIIKHRDWCRLSANTFLKMMAVEPWYLHLYKCGYIWIDAVKCSNYKLNQTIIFQLKQSKKLCNFRLLIDINKMRNESISTPIASKLILKEFYVNIFFINFFLWVRKIIEKIIITDRDNLKNKTQNLYLKVKIGKGRNIL